MIRHSTVNPEPTRSHLRTDDRRSRLSDLYGANADGEWRFDESEAHRREFGAFDETSGCGAPDSEYIGTHTAGITNYDARWHHACF